MAIKKRPISPRQKMINLMYVVLMAMLALNVSNEVLDGFSIVEESLNRTTENSSNENQAIYGDFEAQMKSNPQKVKAWFEKATAVKNMSDSLFNFAQQLKIAIVKEADGNDGDVMNINRKDDLEAANRVMLAPGSGQGEKLYNAINSFREKILKMVSDERQRNIIASNLTTQLPKNAKTMGKNWQEYMFEDMPVAAAVTLLSKLQSDIRYAEGEVLHTLVANIDMKDIRVNKLSAFVIPNSQTIVRGDKFSAKIVMAAVDTTQHPQIFIGGREMKLRDDTYEIITGRTGDFNLTGYITMLNGNGETIRRDFNQKYTVVDPSATVSADLMNVLYAGFNNPISISIPGVPLNKVSATMTGGTLQPVGPGKYIARPSAVGKDITINVMSLQSGNAKTMGQYTFHVRKLPDPTPYIQIGDNRFRTGGLAKASLMNINGIKAAIDDGLLDIPFKVLGFETVFYDNMGNAVPMVSNGDSFSQRQRETFRTLSRNRRFYITRITAIGPDGIKRSLPSAMEIIVK
ncbi:MAG: gliding motility protein GldM [Prevotella sp.]|nr:gliding motility protein GldM [Paraprevotella sp.]MCI6201513.1 gliding motility protein GldM [Paraprevotella sp.]MDD5855061.1 gliding motility protein GldM [Prevotella sp.]MDD7692630.1 gliding motility protein GldM [Prevotella sp.]MDY4407689.1 gliding motility protein GldM [Prevotella sp.]